MRHPVERAFSYSRLRTALRRFDAARGRLVLVQGCVTDTSRLGFAVHDNFEVSPFAISIPPLAAAECADGPKCVSRKACECEVQQIRSLIQRPLVGVNHL
jgi:hypothetical protein